MAFTKVETNRKYYKYAECTPGQKLVDAGIYTGPSEGKFGVQHSFAQADGTTVVLNSSGHLNWLLENHVVPGKLVNVFYADKVLLTRGTYKGKEAHNFELEVDDGAGITRHSESAVAPTSAAESLADISL